MKKFIKLLRIIVLITAIVTEMTACGAAANEAVRNEAVKVGGSLDLTGTITIT
jgi:hypothetical protein